MEEYKVIYRDGDIYKIIDKIFSEDSATTIASMIIKAGYEDCRIEQESKSSEITWDQEVSDNEIKMIIENGIRTCKELMRG